MDPPPPPSKNNQQPSKKQIKIHEHLYQQYPNIPKFANDPEESPIIRVYDLMLKRFQGIYGRQPSYFVRSPASSLMLGSLSHEVSLSIVSFCSIQNVIVAGCVNGHNKIRFNHYQNAMYGEKTFENEVTQWRYDQKNDEYTNIILAALKCFGISYAQNLSGNMQHSAQNNSNSLLLPGMDILIYDDFIRDQFMHWNEALSLGIRTCIGACVYGKKNNQNLLKETLTPEGCIKYLKKVQNFLHKDIKIVDLPVLGQYGSLTITPRLHFGDQFPSFLYFKFPQNLQILIAHSMTPLPKKLTQGKRHNLRSCQIHIAIQLIKSELGAVNQISSIRDLITYMDCNSIKQFMDTIVQFIPKGELTAQKIQQLTEKSLIDILKEVPFANNVIDENVSFQPYKRIMHYLLEQQLVQTMISSARNGNTVSLTDLIKKSHQNSQKYLENTSQQLQEMINLTQSLSQAHKIIGDGWGGNLLILCEKNKSQHIVDVLYKEFYLSEKNKILLSDDLQQYVTIVGQPANGLSILDPSNQIWF